MVKIQGAFISYGVLALQLVKATDLADIPGFLCFHEFYFCGNAEAFFKLVSCLSFLI